MIRWTKIAIPAFTMAFSVAGLGGGGREFDSVDQRVLFIAEEFLNKEYPYLKKDGLRTIVKSREKDWLVTYEFPPKFSDGVKVRISYPVLLIDKNTFEVIKIYEEQ